MSLKGRLILFIFILVLLVTGVLAVYFYNNLAENLEQEKKAQVRQLVDSNINKLKYYQELVEEDELTAEQARQRASQELESAVYGPDNQDYFWIQTQEPVMIMHPFKPELEGQQLGNIQDEAGNYLFREMVEVVEQQDSGFVRYHWQYYDNEQRVEPKLSYVREFEPWGWIVGTGIYINDIQQSLAGLRQRILIISLILLVLALGGAYVIARYIVHPIETTTAQVEEIAGGDLRRQIPEDLKERQDEVGQLARSFAKMTESLREMIGQIAEIASSLSASSQELSASTEEISASAEQVGNAMQTVASGAEEQSAQVQETNSTMTELKEEIERVNTISRLMDERAGEVMDSIEKGNSSVGNSINKIQNIKENSTEVASTIDQLGESSNRIGEIIELIADIADQTNLLALNAAIEAARAGEAGRGFSVVADEIRELAEESAGATGRIADLVEEVQQQVNNAVDRMDDTEEMVAEGVEVIKSTGQVFGEINQAVDKLVHQITAVNKKAKSVDASSEEVELAIEQIASVSQQAASNAEEVAASSQEQSASIQEIVDSAENLAEMAEKLSATVDRFQL